MTVESATYINQLNSSLPVAAGPAGEGDDHIRLLKSTIQATFPNITGAVTPTHTELNYVDGVTSAIQTQLNARPTISGTPTAGNVTEWTDADTVEDGGIAVSALWHSGNDGAGSGLDADTLDGQEGSYYKAAATTSAAGVVEKATQAEVQDGTADKFPDCATLVGTTQVISQTTGGDTSNLGSIEERLDVQFVASGKFLFATMHASATASGRSSDPADIRGYLRLYNVTQASVHTTGLTQYAHSSYYGNTFGTLCSSIAVGDLTEGDTYELQLFIGKNGVGTFTPTGMTITGINFAV